MAVSWQAALSTVLAVGLMGFAIQRGGTCTVAAVDEMVSQRRGYRMAALLEASLWVVGGLALAQGAGIAGSMPAGHAATLWTVAGGALLGLGAWVNGACVFGAVARLGTGDWAQALMPLGYFTGCLAATAALRAAAMDTGPALAAAPAPWVAPAGLAPMFVLYALARSGAALLQGWRKASSRNARWPAPVWAPHTATIVIGVMFVLTLLLAGPWAYTDALGTLARALHAALHAALAQMTGMTEMTQTTQFTQDGHAALVSPTASDGGPGLAWPLLLFAALVMGAIAGGRSARLWQHRPPQGRTALRALLGGALMGAGGMLIPGSNDSLVLIGIPLLQPFAWLAFASMVLAIAAALLAQRVLKARALQPR